MVNGDQISCGADPFVPSQRSTCLHCQSVFDRCRKYFFPVVLRLRFEKLPARHAHHPYINFFLSMPCWEFFESQSDRKSTRLNSSHVAISYAVFCLKKKK